MFSYKSIQSNKQVKSRFFHSGLKGNKIRTKKWSGLIDKRPCVPAAAQIRVNIV